MSGRTHHPPQTHNTAYNWSATFDCGGVRRNEVQSQLRNREIVVWASTSHKFQGSPPPTSGCHEVQFYQAVTIPGDVNPESLKHRWISHCQLQFMGPKRGRSPRSPGRSPSSRSPGRSHSSRSPGRSHSSRGSNRSHRSNRSPSGRKY